MISFLYIYQFKAIWVLISKCKEKPLEIICCKTGYFTSVGKFYLYSFTITDYELQHREHLYLRQLKVISVYSSLKINGAKY